MPKENNLPLQELQDILKYLQKQTNNKPPQSNKEQTPRIKRSRMRTPDGTILESKFTHDFQSHFDTKTKHHYFIDGGTDYIRYGVDGPEDFELLTDYWD